MRCMPRLASFSRSAEARPGAAALQPLWGRRAVYRPRPAGARARWGGSHMDLAQRRGLGRAALAARRSLPCRKPVARLVVRARRAHGVATTELRHSAVARAHPGLRRLPRGRRRASPLARAATMHGLGIGKDWNRLESVSPLRLQRRKTNVRAPAPARRDLQLEDGARRGAARLPNRAGKAARHL